MSSIERKRGHIKHALAQTSKSASAFDAVRLKHCALPEVNLDEVSLKSSFQHKTINAPFFVSSMTGGPSEAEAINIRLAEACREVGLAMGVGSQRVSIEDGYSAGLSASIRRAIGDLPLFANFGAVNLARLDHASSLGRVIDPLEADALILHVNPMQEVFQASGDTDWTGILSQIERVCAWSAIPVIAKEVGFGLDTRSARQLVTAGVSILDVAGRGGTRFDDIEIEMHSNISSVLSSPDVFKDWGYTTIESLRAIQDELPAQRCWASGGVRNGLDIVKSLCLGAEAAGMAGRLLKPALESTEAVISVMHQLLSEIRIACFGLGVRSVKDLGQSHIFQLSGRPLDM